MSDSIFFGRSLCLKFSLDSFASQLLHSFSHHKGSLTKCVEVPYFSKLHSSRFPLLEDLFASCFQLHHIRTVESGAQTTIYCAVDEKIADHNGRSVICLFYHPDMPMNQILLGLQGEVIEATRGERRRC